MARYDGIELYILSALPSFSRALATLLTRRIGRPAAMRGSGRPAAFAATLAELVPHKFLTEGQLRILTAGRAFLWRIRFGLHLLTGRREDRLLFDHQVKLAQMLGYEDASFTLAVEQLMQRYYRTVMELSRLN